MPLAKVRLMSPLPIDSHGDRRNDMASIDHRLQQNTKSEKLVDEKIVVLHARFVEAVPTQSLDLNEIRCECDSY